MNSLRSLRSNTTQGNLTKHWRLANKLLRTIFITPWRGATRRQR
jgi:hypothetical protein